MSGPFRLLRETLREYGIEDIFSMKSGAMRIVPEKISCDAYRLFSGDPDAEQIARISEDQFALVDAAGNEKELEDRASRTSGAFFRDISGYNSEKIRSWLLEVNCGCTKLSPGWDDIPLESMIRLAVGEMYLNRLRSSSSDRIRKEQNIAGLTVPTGMRPDTWACGFCCKYSPSPRFFPGRSGKPVANPAIGVSSGSPVPSIV